MGQLRKVDPIESGSLDHFASVRWYAELVEGPDGERRQNGKKRKKNLSRPLMKLDGVGIDSPYPRLDLDPLYRQWELSMVKIHTER